MDQFTIGAIGLSFLLSRYLRKESRQENYRNEAPAEVGMADDAVRTAILMKDITTIKRLLPKVKDAGIRKSATDYLSSQCDKEVIQEHANWKNFQQKALSTFKDKPIKDYIHNNFVPFGSKNTQNMAGTGVRNGNYTHGSTTKDGVINAGFGNATPYTQKLGHFTGRDELRPRKSDAHAPNQRFLAHESQRSNVSGGQVFRPDNDRYANPTGKRHDLKPVEAVRVGPGLGIPANQPHHGGGYQSYYRPEAREITSKTTSRGTEKTVYVPGKDQASAGKGYAAYAPGLKSQSLEAFTQTKGGSAFVNKKCNSFVTTQNREAIGTTSQAQAETKRADHTHRGDTLRSQETNYVGPGGSEVVKTAPLSQSYMSDKHNIHSARESHTYAMGNGHYGNGTTMNQNSNWYVNGTDRGEVGNSHVGFAASEVSSGTRKFGDSARTTLRESGEVKDMRNVAGSSNFTTRNDDKYRKTQRGSETTTFGFGGAEVSGAMSLANFNTAQVKDTKQDVLVGSRPLPGRRNAVGAANERLQNVELNHRGEDQKSRLAYGHSAKPKQLIGDYQVKTGNFENNVRDPTIGSFRASPYRSIPIGSRAENCHTGAS